jgi:hypothetical protein
VENWQTMVCPVDRNHLDHWTVRRIWTLGWPDLRVLIVLCALVLVDIEKNKFALLLVVEKMKLRD